MRGRQGLLWLVVILMCLMLVCLGHVIEAFVAPPQEEQSGEAGEPIMTEPSRFPTGGAVITRSAVPTAPAPLSSNEPELARSGGRWVLTVAYDNNPHDPRLRQAWGFACLVETPHGVVLFDTGGDGGILMQNIATLGIDPAAIDAVVLSHNHTDHVGGLQALLASNNHLVVYVPASFAMEISRLVGGRAVIVEVSGPIEIFEGVHTTGEMGTAVVEQSLIVETDRGLIVVTGCAHPGIVEIVRQATAQGEVDLVIGGFHLSDRSRRDVQTVVEEVLALRVRRIAPCHCTGPEASAEFEAAFGAGFVPCGVGAVIAVGQ